MPPTASELRARAHRLIAKGHRLLAEAEALDAPPVDGWLDLDAAAQAFPVTARMLRDAGARGELVLHRAGGGKRGRPVVRRSEVEGWLASRPVSANEPKATAAGQGATAEDDDAAYLRLVRGALR